MPLETLSAPTVTFTARKFVLDKGKFTNALAEDIRQKMLVAGRLAFDGSHKRIPTWTGESRESLNAIIVALGGNPKTVVPRRGAVEWVGMGRYPGSAEEFTVGPTYDPVRQRIFFRYFTTAEGFILGDTKPLANTEKAPFKFARTFSKLWKAYLMHEIKKSPGLPVSKFSYTQRRRYPNV